MNNTVKSIIEAKREEIIAFAQALVRTKSITCNEEALAKQVKARMKELGFDTVEEDKMGNIIGVIGSGSPYILFDSHMDTVGVMDEEQWSHDPFGGEIVDGKLYGRGSSDMKSGLVSSIYGVYAAKKAGLLPANRSIWVCCTLMEEDYDGVALKYVLDEHQIRPEAVIVCEPTDNMRIANGHKGRCLIEITAKGIGCHGCYPEKGRNPVYMLKPIIERIININEEFYITSEEHPTMALTNVYCHAASENSVPQDASVVIDRRMVIGETEETISKEMNELIEGLKDITWRFKDYEGESWTGMKFPFHNFMPAWELSESHPLVKKTMNLVKEIRGYKPEIFKFSGSTNATVSAGMYNIPTVIVGPGNLSLAHARNEFCPVEDIICASKIFAGLASE